MTKKMVKNDLKRTVESAEKRMKSVKKVRQKLITTAKTYTPKVPDLFFSAFELKFYNRNVYLHVFIVSH